MRKFLMTTTAILALAAVAAPTVPVLAASDSEPAATAGGATTTMPAGARYRSFETADPASLQLPEGLGTEEIVGAPVYDARGEHIGEVVDLLLDEGGQVQRILVDVGGFLGMGEHRVALSLDQVQLTEIEGEQRLTVALTQQQLEAMPAFERDQAGWWTERRAEPAAARPAGTESGPAPATAARYRSWDTVGDTDMSVLGELTAKEVIGAPVYDANAEHIGEIADILLGEDDRVAAVLVDVGGFLGMGEHRVALSLDQVQLTEVEGEQRLTVALTQEQLEAMPAFERDQAGWWTGTAR